MCHRRGDRPDHHRGMGELHLEIIVDRMGASSRSRPTSASRRSLTARRSAPAKAKASSSASPAAAASTATCGRARAERAGQGFEFVNGIDGGVIPQASSFPAVEKGIKEAMRDGCIAGYPVVDIKAALLDGSYRDVDSNEIAFKIAASGVQGRLPQGRP